MKLSEMERDLFDKQTETIEELMDTVTKLKESILNKQKEMIKYELKRDKILSSIIPASLFVQYNQQLHQQ